MSRPSAGGSGSNPLHAARSPYVTTAAHRHPTLSAGEGAGTQIHLHGEPLSPFQAGCWEGAAPQLSPAER